jgi:Fe2+ or Zn2+ uptake regulation protein
VYRYFKERVASSIGQASEELGQTFRTVARAVDILQKAGIIAQITKGDRNRIFAHTGLLERMIAP